MNSITTKLKVLEIFAMFLVRDFGFSIDDAKKEAQFFKKLNKPFKEITITNYFRVKRLGSMHSVSRKERVDIFNSFQNSINHATFSK